MDNRSPPISRVELIEIIKRALIVYNRIFTKDIKYLYAKQVDVILRIVNREDTIGLLPTNFGKSIIFEIMPFIFDIIDPQERHCVIIIEPLDVILKEKIDKFDHLGLCVKKDIFTKTTAISETIRFIIGHPEHILSRTSISALKSMKGDISVPTIVVDEAHIVLQWGPKFRQSFQDIGELRLPFSCAPILALTGTLTTEDQSSLRKILNMSSNVLISSNLNRKNIYISFQSRPPVTGGENTVHTSINSICDPIVNELSLLGNDFPKTIIFTTNVVVCGYVMEKAYSSDLMGRTNVSGRIGQYHGASTKDMKEAIHGQFLAGDILLLMATEAFSMGADIPNIRRIIFIGPPGSIKTYYQEVGRCGRDGKVAVAVCYYNGSDIRRSKPGMTEEMRNLAMGLECRRKTILKHFSQDYMKSDNHICCDICENSCDCDECILKRELIPSVSFPTITPKDDKQTQNMKDKIIMLLISHFDSLELSMNDTIQLAKDIVLNKDTLQSVSDIKHLYHKIPTCVCSEIFIILTAS